MDEITGMDIEDIERLCKQLREGHLDDDDFRKEVLMALGYDKEVVDGEQQLKEIAALWE